MRQKRLIMSVLLVFAMNIALTGMVLPSGAKEPKAAELINWNEPKPMAERLSADKYILPKGWKKATEGVNELVYMNPGGMAHDIATKINMTRFEQLTGIKIRAIETPVSVAYSKTLASLVAKDKSLHLPSAVNSEYDLSSYIGGNWLIPLDALYSPESEILNLYSPAIKHYKINGHWWASPSCQSACGLVMFYRPSWLKNAGVDHPPTTWEELYTAARKVRTWAKQNLGEDYYGIAFPGTPAYLVHAVRSTVYSQGERLWRDGKYRFLSSEFKNALEYWVNFVKEGIASPSTLTYSTFDAARVFGMGKAGFCGPTYISYTMKYQTEFPEVAGDWAVSPPLKWDKETPEKYRSGIAAQPALMIPNYIDEKHQAAAMLFLDYIRSKEASRYELLVEGNDTYFLSLYDEVDIAEKVNWDLADKVAKELGIPRPRHVKSVQDVKAKKLTMQNLVTTLFPPGFRNVTNKLQEEWVKVAQGKVTVEEACEKIQTFTKKVSPGG